jgi:hypothetical protein
MITSVRSVWSDLLLLSYEHRQEVAGLLSTMSRFVRLRRGYDRTIYCH